MNQLSVKADFIPGDVWIYYKIYTGYSTSDTILTELIRPMVTTLLQEKLISEWFFIRYGDPDHHLRIRFKMTDNLHLSAIIQLFNRYIQPYLANNLIWKIQLDTYKRELDRYAPQLIEHAERIFFIESEMIVNAISVIEESGDPNLRWLFGVYTIDAMLEGFKLEEETRLKLLSNLKDSFETEFNMDKQGKKLLADKFRKHRKEIDNFLDKETNHETIQHLHQLAAQKNQHLAPVYEDIIVKMNNSEGVMQLLSSYIHMLMNRLFRSKNRQNETVAYFLLFSHYRSSLARKKAKKPVKDKIVAN